MDCGLWTVDCGRWTALLIPEAHHSSSLSRPPAFIAPNSPSLPAAPQPLSTILRLVNGGQCGRPQFLFPVGPDVPLGLWRPVFHLLVSIVSYCVSLSSSVKFSLDYYSLQHLNEEMISDIIMRRQMVSQHPHSPNTSMSDPQNYQMYRPDGPGIDFRFVFCC